MPLLSPRLAARFLLASFLAGLAAAAQGAPQHAGAAVRASNLASIARQSAGLSDFAGELWATGTRYAARLTPNGLEFRPAFGKRGSGAEHVRLELLELRRGAQLVLEQPAAGAAQRESADSLRAQRTPWPGVHECFEARAAGVEHSLSFDRPVGEAGELVARFALRTDLHARSAGASIVFEREGLGQISLGAVTGIDAAGRRVPGELRLLGDSIEYALPASFVDTASWPLVIDPQLGGALVLDDSSDARDFGVAYGGTSDSYLVAWMVETGSLGAGTGVGNLVAQRIGGNGALIGSQIALDLSGRVETVRVGWCRNPNRFLLVWTRWDLADQRDLYTSGVLASTGAFSSAATLLFSPSTKDDIIDIANETTSADDELLVIYHSADSAGHSDVLRQVTVPASGAPFLAGSTVTLPANGVDFRISTQGGDAGRFLVVYTDSTAPGVRGQVFDRNANALTAPTTLVNTASIESYPYVDGDGTRFLIGWTQVNSTTLAVSARIGSCRYVPGVPANTLKTIVSSNILAAPVGMEALVTGIALTSEGALATWVEGSGIYGALFPPQATAWVRQIDPISASPLGPSTLIYASLATPFEVQTATQFQGIAPASLVDSDARDEALVVSEAGVVVQWGGPYFELHALRYECPGRSVDLAGGCGSGGKAFAAGPFAGNASFELRLDGAAASASTFALVGKSWSGFGCGSCALRLDPASLIALPRTTDAYGATYVLQSIPAEPALAGASFGSQWATIPSLTQPQCAALACDLSNALQITLE